MAVGVCCGNEPSTACVKAFLTGMPQRFEVAKHRALLHGAVIEIDDARDRAVKIQRVSESAQV